MSNSAQTAQKSRKRKTPNYDQLESARQRRRIFPPSPVRTSQRHSSASSLRSISSGEPNCKISQLHLSGDPAPKCQALDAQSPYKEEKHPPQRETLQAFCSSTSANATSLKVITWLHQLPTKRNVSTFTLAMPKRKTPSTSDISASIYSSASILSSGETSSPNYRSTCLANHNVRVNDPSYPPTSTINEFVRTRVVSRQRSNESFTEEEVSDIRALIELHATSSEAIFKMAIFAKDRLFPSTRGTTVRYPKLESTSEKPYSVPGLPHCEGLSPIPYPKPDLCYGYNERAFTKDQHRFLREFESFCNPIGEIYFPALVVEVKDDLTSLYYAENQAAGSGAHTVNSINQILECWVHDDSSDAIQGKDTHNLAFSCCLSPRMATLRVHYKIGDTFASAEIDSFNIRKSEQLREFRRQLHNIYDWLANERLSQIKTMIRTNNGEAPERSEPAISFTSSTTQALAGLSVEQLETPAADSVPSALVDLEKLRASHNDAKKCAQSKKPRNS